MIRNNLFSNFETAGFKCVNGVFEIATSLSVASLSGVIKSTGGLFSGGATTSDLPEGTNLYWTYDRLKAAVLGSSSVTVTPDDTLKTLTLTSIGSGGIVVSITGTSNRITISGTPTVPIIDIASTYIGQSSITTLGTITSGVWQGTAIADAYIASAATWNAKLTSVLTSGNIFVGNVSNVATSVSVSGDITINNTGVTAIGANKVLTANILNSNVTLAKIANIADATILGNNTGGAAAPVALTSSQTRTVLGLATGDAVVFGSVSATTFTGALTGNASTATIFQTPRNINGVSFNGSANITVTAAAGTLTGATLAAGVTASSLTSVGTLTSLAVSGDTTINTNKAQIIGSVGNMCLGSTISANIALELSQSMTGLTGVSQYGVNSSVTFSSAATTEVALFRGRINTAAAAFTVTNAYGVYLRTPSKGATSAITNAYGIFIEAQTAGSTLNYAIKTAGGLVGFGDDVKLETVGKGLYIKEGTNATMGVATLVLGVVVVNTTKVTANSRIFLTHNTLGTITVPVAVAVTARTAGTSFTITSANLTDTSTIAWVILEPAP